MSVFPTKILLATDGSDDAALATRAAMDLASKGDAELHLVHVWRDVPSPYAHAFIKRELERQGQEILDGQVAKIEGAGGQVSGAHLKGGRISDEVLRLSRRLDAGLLVLGSRGHGRLGRILLGSHAEDIIHRAHLPVLVLRRGEETWPPKHVVVGEDFSEDAKKAAELAASIGELFGIRAILAHAYPPVPEGTSDDVVRQVEQDLEARAEELESSMGYHPETRLTAGDAALAVIEAARHEAGPTLLAVGSRGLGAVGRARLGSTSTKVIRAARGPVLICPHER